MLGWDTVNVWVGSYLKQPRLGSAVLGWDTVMAAAATARIPMRHAQQHAIFLHKIEYAAASLGAVQCSTGTL